MRTNQILLLIFILSSCSTRVKYSDVKKEEIKVNYVDYYNAINRAKIYYNLKLYNKSFKLYDSVFNNFSPKNTVLKYEYEDYLTVAYKVKKYKPINLGVKKLIKDFGYTYYYFDRKSILKNVFLKSDVDSVDYKKYRKEYLRKVNFSLRDTILRIVRSDQKYRRGYDKPDRKQKQDSIDKINEKLLIYIFEKYGYPNDELIGNGSVKKAKGIEHTILSATLMHTKDSIRLHYFLPKILNFIKEGTCEPFIYAKMADNYLFIKERKQLYGTFVNLRLIDSVKIDSIRLSIGLPKIRKRINKIHN